MNCPRCKTELAAKPDADRWRCETCRGVAITSPELVRRAREHAPDLADAAPAPAPVVTCQDPIACPQCSGPMERIQLGHLEVDRCTTDRMLWFDDWEHVELLAAASDPEKRASLRAVIAGLA